VTALAKTGEKVFPLQGEKVASVVATLLLDVGAGVLWANGMVAGS
jgi:hypothetical protein